MKVSCSVRKIKTFAAMLVITLAAALAASLTGACNVFLGPESASDPHAVLKSLWTDFNEIHAYIDIRMSDNPDFESWEEVYEYYNALLKKRIPPDSPDGDRDGTYLFDTCKDMLSELMDPHVSLFAPGGNYYWLRNDDIQKREEKWFNLAVIKKNYLLDNGIDKGGFFTYGRFKSEFFQNIGYIYIASFVDSEKLEQTDWPKEIDGITKFFQDENLDAIVIDIRNNSGGSGQIAEYIAGRFTSVQKNYMKASVKNGPGRDDFSESMTFRVRPEGTRFTKCIALLTNKATVSAAEWFTMALKSQSHVRHMGTTTRGAFSPKTSRPMINGWYYTISAYRVTDISGECFEGKGISPEYIFTGSLEEEDPAVERQDTQLDNVLMEVRRWLNP
jgi:C-terminal processing protease CtpA/Prc